MAACAALVLTIPTFVALVGLLFWVAVSTGGNRDNQNDGEYRPWWDFDRNPEEMQSIKIVLNLVYLIIACGTLFVPIIKAGSGVYERFNVGALAASMFMFANMLFVSFWYLVDFGRREENDKNEYYNNNYDNNRYWMDERELLAYNQKVVSYVVLALAVLFFVISAGIYGSGEMLPQTLRGSSIHQTNILPVASQFEALGQTWTFLSLCSIVVFVGLFIATLLLFLGGEDVNRMVEEARIINLVTVLLWMSIVTIVMLVQGNALFSEKRWGSFGVGTVYGGTKYFSALLLMVCILFANLSFDERKGEEGVWVTSATSISCLVLAMLQFVFSMKARSYQISLYDLSTEKGALDALDSQTEMVHNTSDNYVRAV